MRALLSLVAVPFALSGCTERYFDLLPREEGAGSGGAGVSGSGGTDVSSSGGVTQVGGSGGGPSTGFGGLDGGDGLLHRYDFSGSGAVLVDLVGDADGDIRGGALLTGTGSLTLDGNDDYVALPERLISGLDEVTLVAWLTWGGFPERCWQRVFDFGNNDAAVQGDAGNGTSALFLTASDCPHYCLTASIESTTGGQTVRGPSALSETGPSFVALVLSDPEQLFVLYHDGVAVSGTDQPKLRAIAEIDDKNNWLGRSQWIQDQQLHLRASYDEFRIYGRALDAAAILALGERGPDAP